MKEFWDERYSASEYAYGIAANEFLVDTLDQLKINGKALFPADGEGRNSVYAALRGLDVYAFDISLEGQKKALKLAEEKGVSVHYEVGNLNDLDLANKSYDAIVLTYAHFPADVAKRYFPEFVEMLNPGGYIIFEGFSVNHIPYRERNPAVGGPMDPDILFTTDRIQAAFSSLETLLLEEKEVELKEGLYHNGLGMVVRYIGRK